MLRYRGITVTDPASPPAQTAGDYRRQARRLRCEHAGNPIRLHQSLAQLAEAQQPASVPTVRAVPTEAFFADLVAAELTGPVLTYSKRLELLREAQRRGIGRFQANLIIAQVQYRSPERGSTELPRRPWVSVALMFVATQAFIATLVWLTIG